MTCYQYEPQALWHNILDGANDELTCEQLKHSLSTATLFDVVQAPLLELYRTSFSLDESESVLPCLKILSASPKARQTVEEGETFLTALFDDYANASEQTIEFLNKLNWPLYELDPLGHTILHLAIQFRYPNETIQTILSQAPNLLNMKNKIGDSPMLFALAVNRIEHADLMYSLGAELPPKGEDINLPGQSLDWLHHKWLRQQQLKAAPVNSQNVVSIHRKRGF